MTSRIERICSQKIFGEMRAQHGYKTRHKKRAPPNVKIKVPAVGSSTETLHEIVAPEAPYVPFALPLFELPGILSGRPTGVGRKQDNLLWLPPMGHDDGENWRKIDALLQGDTLGFQFYTDHFAMARLLCKIAFCECVAWLGREHTPNDLIPAIIGLKPHLTDFVGKSLFPAFGSVDEPAHRATIILWEGYPGLRLLCHIELFNKFGGPAFLVVVGTPDAAALEFFGHGRP